MRVFDPASLVDIHYSAQELTCVARAISDLSGDLRKLSGREPAVKPYLPVDEEGLIVVGTLTNAGFAAYLDRNGLKPEGLAGTWEGYHLLTFGSRDRNLLICGADERGTMWGIYELCERYLGVDPLYWWTDNEPSPVEALDIPTVNRTDAPVTFRFRGWFINDEDLFTDWLDGGGKRYTTYRFYHQVTHASIMERVVETALRLRQNMLIPASFVDIENPAEENLIRIASDRGMFVTQHHAEPLGVSHFGWDNYWAARGREAKPSFVTNPEGWREIWTHYVRRWSRYPNVIYQLGLRGRGDRPVWWNDDTVPPTTAERGALISSALEMQMDILRQEVGEDCLVSTTLWMEGSDLQREGALSFPDGAMIIFADYGSSQMMLEDFFETPRERDRGYGVYHHVAFWGDGPHLARGTSLAKLHFNYGQAVSKGDTAYSILNVSNIRPFTLGIEAVARMTWDYQGFCPDAFLDQWSAREYGAGAVAAIREVYGAYHDAFISLDDTLIPGQLILLDGMSRRVALRALDILEGEAQASGIMFYKTWLDIGGEAMSFLEKSRAVLDGATAGWDNPQRAVYDALATVAPDRQDYLLQSWLTPIRIMKGLYGFAHELVMAAQAKQTAGDTVTHLERAAHALEGVLLDRLRNARGKWAGWYRGDTKMELSNVLDRVRRLIAE